MAQKHIIKYWKGSRANYNIIAKAQRLDPWTRYIVKESDDTLTEYYGDHQITEHTGQILPVETVMDEMPSDAEIGTRFLIGNDSRGYKIAVARYDAEEDKIFFESTDFDPNCGVRIKDRDMKNFVYVNSKLVTYDDVDCGNF